MKFNVLVLSSCLVIGLALPAQAEGFHPIGAVKSGVVKTGHAVKRLATSPPAKAIGAMAKDCLECACYILFLATPR